MTHRLSVEHSRMPRYHVEERVDHLVFALGRQPYANGVHGEELVWRLDGSVRHVYTEVKTGKPRTDGGSLCV